MVRRFEMSPASSLDRRSIAAALLAALAPLLASCATLAGGGGGDVDLPNAGAGPFRALGEGELGNSRSPPNALFDAKTSPRDGSILDLDGDPSTLDVAGFFAANAKGEPLGAPPSRVVRYGAVDARSFDRAAEVILEPQLPWEGGFVAAPSALRVGVGVGGEVWIYYEGAGGVGLARSSDGAAFSREPGPVLEPDATSWEKGAVPRSPGVALLWDGTYRMFYEVDPAGDGRSMIGEARSDDGVTWTRVGDAPALEPSNATSGAPADDAPFDGASVGSPFPVAAIAATGEKILRVYYGAKASSGASVIALAARFGADGPLERAASPVFGAGKSLAPREPCVVVYEGFSLLFATQRSDLGDETLAVAAGVAPANAHLPPANPL